MRHLWLKLHGAPGVRSRAPIRSDRLLTLLCLLYVTLRDEEGRAETHDSLIWSMFTRFFLMMIVRAIDMKCVAL